MEQSRSDSLVARKRLRAAPAAATSSRAVNEVDGELVDRAISDLNAIYTARALETACLIGEYIINHFFNGSLDKFGTCGDNHASFRALAKHPDLRFSSTYLWTAVAVLGQLRELPEGVGRCLPLSHHRLLLPLKDPKTKTELAQKALSSNLSKRELAREIGRLRDRGLLRSRKRSKKPEVFKALSDLVEASEDFVRTATSDGGGVAGAGRQAIDPLLERLELDLDAVRCTVAILRSRLCGDVKRRPHVSPGKQPKEPNSWQNH